MLKIDAMRLITIYGHESNYATWRLARMNLAIRGIDVHMSELWKGGKYTITGRPPVDDFSGLLRSE